MTQEKEPQPRVQRDVFVSELDSPLAGVDPEYVTQLICVIRFSSFYKRGMLSLLHKIVI